MDINTEIRIDIDISFLGFNSKDLLVTIRKALVREYPSIDVELISDDWNNRTSVRGSLTGVRTANLDRFEADIVRTLRSIPNINIE